MANGRTAAVAGVRRLGEAAAPIWRHRVAGPTIRIGLGVIALPLLMNVFLPGTRPPGVMFNGVIIGSLFGLVAIGLILVYRANNVINFAQAGLGAVPAVFALILMAEKGWPYFAALPVAIIGALLLGAVVEVVIIRRFASAPRLILAVATIGVGQLLAFFEFHTPRWITGEVIPSTDFPTPLGGFEFTVFGSPFTGDHVFALVVVVVSAAGLGAFFRFTRIGMAVRASAENADRAALLGIPVKRLSTVVWMLAAVLSALGIFLRAPIVGLPLGTVNSPSILLYAFAAAVLARFERLPTALLSGMAMGVVFVSVPYSTRDSVLSDAWMLPIILVALLLQRGSLGRARDTGQATWRTVKEFRPIPSELRNVREVVAFRTALIAGAIILAIGLPFLVSPPIADSDYRNDASMLLIYAMLGVSLVILTGWAGQISLGQFAFAGIGAAVAGGLAVNHGQDFFVTMIAAGLVGAVVAVLIGVPALRLQGLLLAVSTLAFAAATRSFFLNRRYFDWLLPERGKPIYRPQLYGRIDAADNLVFYYLCLVFLVLAVLCARSLRNSRSGRVLVAARDNSRAAQSYGVNLSRTKLSAFALSGYIAASAGGLFAYQQGAVDVAAFPMTESVTVFAVTVVGGLTSVAGGVAGAVYLVAFKRFPFLQDFELLATGVGMMFLLLFLPGGLTELGVRGRDTFLRWIAAKRGIHVPSLVADTREAQADAMRGQHDEALLIEVGEEVEHGRSLVATAEPTITCPACGEVVAVDAALEHEHFRAETPAASRRASRSRSRVRSVAAEPDSGTDEGIDVPDLERQP